MNPYIAFTLKVWAVLVAVSSFGLALGYAVRAEIVSALSFMSDYEDHPLFSVRTLDLLAEGKGQPDQATLDRWLSQERAIVQQLKATP